jgi:hypothetical protein
MKKMIAVSVAVVFAALGSSVVRAQSTTDKVTERKARECGHYLPDDQHAYDLCAIKYGIEPASTSDGQADRLSQDRSTWANKAQVSDGPFGFERGMTVEQVTKLLGKPVKDNPNGSVTWDTAPKPYPAFEAYLLTFSPKDGLLKVIAIGKDIQTGENGSQLKSAYVEILDAISTKYGPADTRIPRDYCTGNSTECQSEYWMLTLFNKDRIANTFWIAPTFYPNFVTTIDVDCVAQGLNKGYFTAAFEFLGWSAYVESINSKQNSNF